jgi:hypothetical protein
MDHVIPSTQVVDLAYDAAEHCLGCATAASMEVEGAVGWDGNEAGAILSGGVAAISCDDRLRPFCGFCGALIEAGTCTDRHSGGRRP